MYLVGEYFVSSGTDCIVKLWNYELGEVIANGYGHAGIVTACKYSPDSKFLVTGGQDGAVFLWKIPEEFHIDQPVREKVMKKCNTNVHLRQPEQIREIGRRMSRGSSLVSKCPPVGSVKSSSSDAGSVCGETTRSLKWK